MSICTLCICPIGNGEVDADIISIAVAIRAVRINDVTIGIGVIHVHDPGVGALSQK